MCDDFAVGDILASICASRDVLNMLSTAHSPSATASAVLLEGCTFVATLALVLVLLTAVYMLLLAIMVAVALSRLPLEQTFAELSDRFIALAASWRRLPAVDARSLERTCPVRDHAAPEARCAVCLDPMKAGDPTRTLPCEHEFHRPCIDAWIGKGANRCPLCNARILPVTTRDPCTPNREGAPTPPAAAAAAAAAASAAAAVANAVALAPEERDREQPVRVPWRRRLWTWMRIRRRR